MAYTGNPSLEHRAEAVRLRGVGYKLQTIADKLGVSEAHVRRLTSSTWVKKQTVELVGRAPKYQDCVGVKVHAPRSVRRIIAEPDRIIAAAREFVAGRISRNELMLRVSNHV